MGDSGFRFTFVCSRDDFPHMQELIINVLNDYREHNNIQQIEEFDFLYAKNLAPAELKDIIMGWHVKVVADMSEKYCYSDIFEVEVLYER